MRGGGLAKVGMVRIRSCLADIVSSRVDTATDLRLLGTRTIVSED